MKKKIIAIDFDATITNGWGWIDGKPTFPPPLDKAKEVLQYLQKNGCLIVIYTARTDLLEVRDYLIHYDIPYDGLNDHTLVPPNLMNWRKTGSKLVADVYVDDKGVSFDGKWTIELAEQILKFTSWARRDSCDDLETITAKEKSKMAVITKQKRPSFPLAPFGIEADQIAFFTRSSNLTNQIMRSYVLSGAKNWTIDTVVATVIEGTNKGELFKATLHFNYDVFPCEFEILQTETGTPPHISGNIDDTGFSHIGFHVEDIENTVIDIERKTGKRTVHIVETLHHSSCPHRYQYALIDTKNVYGFTTKLIKRIEK
jgi:hypothetical protein